MNANAPVVTLIVAAHPEDVARLFSTVCAGAEIAVVAEEDGLGRELETVGRALGARGMRALTPAGLEPWCREQAARGGVRVFTHSPQEEAPRHRDVCLAVSRVFDRLQVPALGARPTAFQVLDDAAFQRKLELLNALYRDRPGGTEACTHPVRDGLGVEAFCEVRHADVVRALSLTKPEIFAELEDPWGFTHSTYERERYALTAHVLGALTGSPPRSVVDVGACEGLMTERLRSLFPEAVVHAVEADPHFVARLRQRLGGDARVRIVEASALDVPLEADLVLLAEVLYYLPVEAGRELLGRIRASHLLTSYGGPFGEEVHAALRELGWRQVVCGSLPARIEPVDGVASPLLVRRAGTDVRLWSR
jgi:hypothetical protein